MPSFITRTAKLVPSSRWAKATAGHVTAYSFEPAGEGAKLGHLLVVAEVLAPSRQAEEAVDRLIDTAGQHFFNEATTSQTAAQRFEITVKAVNQALSQLVNEGKAAWVGKLSAALAVTADHDLHLTNTGSAEAYLYRHGRPSRISTVTTKKGQNQALKSFDQIISGKLQIGDRLLLATPGLIHQVSADQLGQIVADSSPEGAITKLTAALQKQSHLERVAGLVAEITTTDLLALQIRTNQPTTAVIGEPANLLSAAKLATGPLAGKTVRTGQHFLTRVRSWIRGQAWPRLFNLIKYGLTGLQRTWRNPRHRRWLIGGGGVLLVAAILLIRQFSASHHLTDQRNRYLTILQQVRQAETQLAANQTDDARSNLNQAQQKLAQLRGQATPNLEASLAARPHAAGDPTTLDALLQLIRADEDKAAGLLTLTGTPTTSFKVNPAPQFLQAIGHQLVLIASTGQVYLYDTATHQFKTSAARPEGLGKVVATAGASDAVYLLTDQPAVWVYHPDTDSLAAANLSFGNWPAGRALATYGGNIYVLGPDNLYKHTPALAGFSAKSPYFSGDDATFAATANALSVDGSISLAGPAGVRRFLGGTLQQSLTPLPDSLAHPGALVTTNDGNNLVMLDAQTHRLALLTISGRSLTLSKQFVLAGGPATAIATDPTTSAIYCLTSGKIIKISL